LIRTHGKTIVELSRNLDQVRVVWKYAGRALLNFFWSFDQVPVLVHVGVLLPILAVRETMGMGCDAWLGR
jgi:hypothetical protein